MILQSHALNLRFETSVIYKRQTNVAGEPLRSIKTKEPRQVAWRPSSAARAEGMAETRQRSKAECHGEGRTGSPHSGQHSELRTGCCPPVTEQFSVQPHREIANRDGMEKTKKTEIFLLPLYIPRCLSPGFILCLRHHHHRVLKPERWSSGKQSPKTQGDGACQ